ncbi:MAG: hypothetical protein A3B37_03670 [Candidatus Sungbacteria bacterium RIFCSPLOWO2_01_FULL_59_16]|uniref:Glycosyl transferase family 1 domain-containing protein n=1 Tax=Candidatus Sungbacteria bacterium RIFCSPLOWO2_01_FULL_59_16 TaxID=1802280 RepID=A0A1G2LBX1_9BACT|nr:MAG: hypothetical protein A3B37_03670 [Candidatus Sungbacteria bacterium RIFCSPLOWO2_01_FULL_59_16]
MVGSGRPRIVYILPAYDSATASHFFHIYELLEAASRDLDIFLVIERAAMRPEHFSFPFYVQRFSNPVMRFAEIMVVLARERMRGRKAFYTHYSYYGALVSWFVVRVVGGEAYYWNCGMPWLYRRGRFAEAVFRFVLRRTILVTGTDGLRAAYCHRYGLVSERTRVLPNGINIERFRSAMNRGEARRALGVPGDVKVVLFVHRLSRRKGAHLLPDIISGVLAAENRVMFIIVGDGPERQHLGSRVTYHEKSGHVRITGGVPHRDVSQYFAAADVFLMPSEEEGFPHVLLEAMAAGVPYVVNDVGGVREITPPELLPVFVVPRTIPFIVQALLGILRASASDRKRFEISERAWVRRFDLGRVRSLFVSLFV